jgi:hypothetical protein
MKLWPWVLGGVAGLALAAGPVMADDRKEPAGDDVRQRLERLEQQVREQKEGTWPRLGGHFGFVIPIITAGGGEPMTEGDAFSIGFPMGITVKKEGPFAFDLELVPQIEDRNELQGSVTIHPGVLYALGGGWTAGLRMAFEVPNNNWGFTPLINKKLVDLTEHSHLFVEMPVPIRIRQDSTTVTVAMHFGIGF